MDLQAMVQQEALRGETDPVARQWILSRLSPDAKPLTIEDLRDAEVRKEIRDLLRIDEHDPYRTLYSWPSRTADLRDLLALERVAERDYLTPEDKSSLIKTLQSTLDMGMSVLSYIGGVLDKPAAATRGVLGGVGAMLRGDPHNAKKGFSQILLMLPFSETYLRPLYQKLGLPIPEEHISGREVLEMWGAPKNVPGFHPKQNPTDALLDAAGLLIDLFAVPYLPRVGGLTAKGRQLYRLGKEAQQVAEMERVLQSMGAKVASLSPQVLQQAARQPAMDIVEDLARQVGIPEQEIRHLRLLGSVPQGTELARNIQEAARLGDAAKLSYIIQDLPAQLRFLNAIEDVLRTVPAVSLEGRAAELSQKVRAPLVLEAPWPTRSMLEALGVPTSIEVGTGETMSKVVEMVGNLPLVRHLRALWDWTRKDVADRVAGPAWSKAVDQFVNTVSSAKDMLVHWRAWHASMANLATKYEQLATFGNNHVGARAFGDIVRYVVEHSRKVTGTLDERAAALARQIFAGQADESMIAFIKELTGTLEGSVMPTLHAFTRKLQQLGAPIEPWRSPFVEWFPRYTPTTPTESGWAAIGPKIFTWQQSGKGRLRRLALDVPGGTVLLNTVSRDPILIRALKRSKLAGEPALVDANHTLWLAGEYVRHTSSGRIGRILGLSGSDAKAVIRYADNTTSVANLSDLIPLPPPSTLDGYIPFPGMTKREQLKAAQMWLAHHGLPTSKAKNFDAQLLETLQLYLAHRYADPFVKTLDPRLQRLFYNELPAKSLKEAKNFIRELVDEFEWPLSSRQISTLAKVWQLEKGTSSLLVRYLRSLRSDRGLFSWDVLDDATRRISYNADSLMALSAVHEMFRRTAFVDDAAKTGLSIEEAWKRLVWPRTKKPLTSQGLATLITSLPEDVVTRATQASGGRASAMFQMLRVPEEVVVHAQRALQILRPATEEAVWVEKIARKYLGWIASWLTVPRPAFHVRNAISNMIYGAIADAPYDTGTFLRTYYDTLSRAVKGEWNQLPFFDEMARLGVWGGEQKLADITLDLLPARQTLSTLTQPLKTPASITEIGQTLAKSASTQAWREAFLQGKPGPIVEAGRQTFGLVEGVGRASVYIAGRNAGMTPAQAKALVDRVLFDYSRLSGFERRYMQPLVMFYGWLRQNLGYLIPRVTIDFGSGPAKLLRGATIIQDRFGGGELPKWLQDNLGFPLWDAENNQTIVVRSLGLPLEDLALIDFELPRFLGKVFARTNPVVKGAYMLATGEDPFTGLPLREAKPTIERVAELAGMRSGAWIPARPLANVLEQYIPFASVVGYYSRLFQPRHAPTPAHEAVSRVIDFATGVKIGTYDLEAQRLNELTELLQERLRRMPGVRSYFRPYLVTETPTPAVQKHMELYKILEKRWRKEATERKKLKQQIAQPIQLGGL